jgi:hypothetical protein
MPEKKHLKGVGKKEQRQYEHIKESAEKSGRYGKRAEEVAARTVLKQHKEIRCRGIRFGGCRLLMIINQVVGIISQADIAQHASWHTATGERRALGDVMCAVSEPSSSSYR